MPKAVDIDERRGAFVAAAWDVIASEGLSAATLRKVANEAGCTTGSLTHYFPDRASLLIEALRRAHYAAGARMVRAAGEAKSPAERLRAILLEALPLDAERLREWRMWVAFWAETANDATLKAENARRYAEWREVMEDAIAPFASGDELAALTTHIVALVDGLGIQVALADQRGGELDQAQRICVAAIERQIASICPSPAQGGEDRW